MIIQEATLERMFTWIRAFSRTRKMVMDKFLTPLLSLLCMGGLYYIQQRAL